MCSFPLVGLFIHNHESLWGQATETSWPLLSHDHFLTSNSNLNSTSVLSLLFLFEEPGQVASPRQKYCQSIQHGRVFLCSLSAKLPIHSSPNTADWGESSLNPWYYHRFGGLSRNTVPACRCEVIFFPFLFLQSSSNSLDYSYILFVAAAIQGSVHRGRYIINQVETVSWLVAFPKT